MLAVSFSSPLVYCMRYESNQSDLGAKLLMMLLLCLAPLPLSAYVEESGSFRQFIMGVEPNAAYDNWLSHTVEAVAEEGGHNDFMPPELDPETTGFGNFQLIEDEDTDSAAQAWEGIFRAFWRQDADLVDELIEQTGVSYELVHFTDTDYDRSYWILRETLNETYVDTGYYAGPGDDVIGSFNHGWGIFILNEDADVPWVCSQVVHVNDDFIAPPFMLELFLRANMGALAFHGTSREAMWNGGEFFNARSISDPSRNENLPFQWFTEFFVDTVRAQGMMPQVIQGHSYDSDIHHGEKPVQISPGQMDGYPNRPIRDISSSHLDWINFTPTMVLPADCLTAGQAEVQVDDYYAVWHGNAMVHAESGLTISGAVSLPGYSGNNQMEAVDEGRNPYEAYDGFIHFELDELPEELEALDWEYLDFYDGPAPPTTENFELFFMYYGPALNALVAYYEDFITNPDTTAPAGPDSAAVLYSSDFTIDLAWSPLADDPNFAGYEVYYDTTEVIDLNSPVWSWQDNPQLRSMLTEGTLLGALEPLETYGVRVRGIDYAGNATPLTPVIYATTLDTTLPEIDPMPPITGFPRGAWPPWLKSRVRSIEPLYEVVIECWFDDVGQPDVELSPLYEWQSGEWVAYAGTIFNPETPPAAGTEVEYRVRVTEDSYLPHDVYDPPQGRHTFNVTSGQHKFYADLEFDDGGLEAGGMADMWNWGEIESGPGGSADGSHAWHATPNMPGSIAYLELPPVSCMGMRYVYMVFEHWYSTALNPHHDHICYDGGLVEVSVNDGESWMPVYPAYGYPKDFQSPPYNDVGAFGGSSEGWVTSVFELDNFNEVGEINLRFTYKTDSPLRPSSGWIVDNVRVTGFPPPPREVQGLTITMTGENEMRLMWQPDAADYYRIYRSTDPYQPMELLDTVTSSWYYDTEAFALPGSNVAYRVVAVFAQ